jgi:hypothetical protein
MGSGLCAKSVEISFVNLNPFFLLKVDRFSRTARVMLCDEPLIGPMLALLQGRKSLMESLSLRWRSRQIFRQGRLYTTQFEACEEVSSPSLLFHHSTTSGSLHKLGSIPYKCYID